jgi:hypothetical protein
MNTNKHRDRKEIRTSGYQEAGHQEKGYQEFIKCVKKGQRRYYINKHSKIFKNVQKHTKTV